MWRYWTWLAVLSAITIEKFTAADSECNEELWQPCKDKLLDLRDNYSVEDYLDRDLEQFCSVAEQNGSCWNEVSITCKEKYPQFSIDTATYFVNKHIFCNKENGTVLLHKKVSDCAANYQSEMENCFPEAKEEDDLSLSDMCQRSVIFLYCLADIGKKHCGEDGLAFGNIYQHSVQQAFKSSCDMSMTFTPSTGD